MTQTQILGDVDNICDGCGGRYNGDDWTEVAINGEVEDYCPDCADDRVWILSLQGD